jgi:cyclohexadieny/prephenate dehydrogenase
MGCRAIARAGRRRTLSRAGCEAVLRFAASGFRDFTRIAAIDVDMWRDVFLNNREAVLEMLARFTEDAQAFGRAIRWGEAGFIEDRIRRAQSIRRGLIERQQA